MSRKQALSSMAVDEGRSTPSRKSPVVFDEDLLEFPAEKVLEYQWPPEKTSDFYLLQEQISAYLGVTSFQRKYPDLERRICGKEEKEYLLEKGIVTKMQADMGLVALRTEDVCDLMIDHYPIKYQEYIKMVHERERRHLIEMTKEQTMSLDNSKLANTFKKAVKDAAEYNAQLAQQRREERCSYYDMQTQIIQYPVSKVYKASKEMTKPSNYPVALLPGQFQEYFRRYTTDELKCLPLGTALKALPDQISGTTNTDLPLPGPLQSEASSDVSVPDSPGEVSSDDADNQEKNEPPAKKTNRFKPPLRNDAICGICLKGPETNKKNVPEELIHCSQCENSGHPSCLDMSSQLVRVIQTYSWQCMECKTCTLCRDPFDEDKMMFCDECDRGYHSFCVGLKEIPVGRWICSLCGMCASCKSEIPGKDPSAKWKHEYTKPRDDKEPQFLQTLCQECSGLFRSGNFCPICLKVYRNDESDLPMVCCDICDRWVHTECDGIDNKAYRELAKDRTKYRCALCRGEKEEIMDSFHRKYRAK